MDKSKTCTKCGEVKHTTEFYKKQTRDGFTTRCKVCTNTANAKWAADNRDKVNANLSKWKKANPDKVKADAAKYRSENAEKVKAARAKWASSNHEKMKAIRASWRAANPEATRIYSHTRRAREREVGGKLSHGITEKLYSLQKGKCACGCGQPLGNDYHIDHIIPIVLGGINADENIQLLRAFCNTSKGAKHPIDFMQQRGYLI